MVDFPIRGITETLNLDGARPRNTPQPATRSHDALDLAATPKAIHEAGLISQQLREELPIDIRRKILSDAITARHRDRTPATTYTMYFSRVNHNKPLGAMIANNKAPISMVLLSRVSNALRQDQLPHLALPHVPGHVYDFPVSALVGHQVSDEAGGTLQNRLKLTIAQSEKLLPCNSNLQNKVSRLPENFPQELMEDYFEAIGVHPQIDDQRTMVPYWEYEAGAHGNANLPALQLDLPPDSSDELPKQVMQNILEAARHETASTGEADYFFARLQRHDLQQRHMDPLPVLGEMGVVQNKVRADGTVAPTKTWAMDDDGQEVAYTRAERLQAETFQDKSNRIMSISCNYQG